MEPTSNIYSTVLKLMGAAKDDYGISRLAFYNPATDRIELYTKDVWMLQSKLWVI